MKQEKKISIWPKGLFWMFCFLDASAVVVLFIFYANNYIDSTLFIGLISIFLLTPGYLGAFIFTFQQRQEQEQISHFYSYQSNVINFIFVKINLSSGMHKQFLNDSNDTIEKMFRSVKEDNIKLDTLPEEYERHLMNSLLIDRKNIDCSFEDTQFFEELLYEVYDCETIKQIKRKEIFEKIKKYELKQNEIVRQWQNKNQFK